MNFNPGDLVRSTAAVFDMISSDTKAWMRIDPGSVGLVLPIEDEKLKGTRTWVRILTPEGIGDCYYIDLEKVE